MQVHVSGPDVLSNYHQVPRNYICTPLQDCLPGPVIVLLVFPRMGRARGLQRTASFLSLSGDRSGTKIPPRHSVRRSGPEQRRAGTRDQPAVLAVARGLGCSRADVLLVTHKSLYPGAGRKRATGSSACPGGRGAFCAGRGLCPAPPVLATTRLSRWQRGRLPRLRLSS